MANREFSVGDRVMATQKRPSYRKPVGVLKVYFGTITGPFEQRSVLDGRNLHPDVPYLIEWDTYDPKDKNFPPSAPSLKGYNIQRLNLSELVERFPEALEEELELLGRLSSEMDAAYARLRKLRLESDDVGKTMALATLRELNTYLEQRKASENWPVD